MHKKCLNVLQNKHFQRYYSGKKTIRFIRRYSSDMSVTEFASRISSMIDKRISAPDTSQVNNDKDLQRNLSWLKPARVYAD